MAATAFSSLEPAVVALVPKFILLRNGSNNPTLIIRPIENVIISLITTPKYSARINFVLCAAVDNLGNNVPANIHRTSSDIGIPNPAITRERKYTMGGVVAPISVNVTNAVDGFDNADIVAANDFVIDAVAIGGAIIVMVVLI